MGEQRTRCPYCAELILTDAKVCRFCQRWLQEEPVSHEGPSEAHDTASEDPVKTGESDTPETRVEDTSDVPEPSRRVVKAKAVKGAFPWLRILLFMAYIALVVGCVMMERHASELLSEAKAKEGKGDYAAALQDYEGVRDRFWFSFSTLDAYDGISRVVDQGGLTPHQAVKPPVLGEFIDAKLEGTAVYWLPLACWPICAILLGLVFLTRLLRIGVAFLALILCAAAVAGTAIQSSWYGLVSIEQLSDVSNTAMNEPLAIFGATYGLMVVTALMTLTRTRRRRRK